MVKARKPKKATPVAFHRIKVRSEFVHEGVKYMKFASKKGITPEGKVITLADNSLVTPA